MIHLDIKKLGKFNHIGHRITGDRTGQSNSRGVGWEYVHVCIDDASRVAFRKIMKTERGYCAVAFLKAAVAYYKSLGITVLRVMTDNGSCYRSRAFASACRRLKPKHTRTKPYTPRTNGKAEAFEWNQCNPDRLPGVSLALGDLSMRRNPASVSALWLFLLSCLVRGNGLLSLVRSRRKGPPSIANKKDVR